MSKEIIEKENQVLQYILLKDHSEQLYVIDKLREIALSPLNQQIFNCICEMNMDRKTIYAKGLKDYISFKKNPQDAVMLLERIEEFNSYSLYIDEDLEYLTEHYKRNIISKDLIEKVSIMNRDKKDIHEILKQINNTVIKVAGYSKEEVYNVAVDKMFNRIVDAINDPDEKPNYLITGLKQIDDLISLQKNTLIHIAGPPGLGKSTFIVDICKRVSEYNKDRVAILLFSLEMKQSEIVNRFIANKSNITVRKLERKAKYLTIDEQKRVKEACEIIKEYPIEIVDKGCYSEDLYMIAQRFAIKNQGKHLLIILDQTSKVRRRSKDLRQEYIDISSQMKNITTDFNSTTIVANQLNSRKIKERKGDFRPQAEDLKESGIAHEDANILLLLHRPSYYEQKGDYNSELMENKKEPFFIIVEKNRDGIPYIDIELDCLMSYCQLHNPNEENVKNKTIKDIKNAISSLKEFLPSIDKQIEL